MPLILEEIKETVSEKEIPCDGRQMFMDNFFAEQRFKEKMNLACDMIRIKNMKIQPTERYLHIVLIDTDSGEQIEMNVKRNIHQKLIDRKIYPEQLIKLFQ